jgi:hypothetical protein
VLHSFLQIDKSSLTAKSTEHLLPCAHCRSLHHKQAALGRPATSAIDQVATASGVWLHRLLSAINAAMTPEVQLHLTLTTTAATSSVEAPGGASQPHSAARSVLRAGRTCTPWAAVGS